MGILHIFLQRRQRSVTTGIAYCGTGSLLVWCCKYSFLLHLVVIRHPWFIQPGMFPPGYYLCSHWAAICDLQQIIFFFFLWHYKTAIRIFDLLKSKATCKEYLWINSLFTLGSIPSKARFKPPTNLWVQNKKHMKKARSWFLLVVVPTA